MHADAAAAAAACMRACVVARVIDTMYQLIYSSAQTQVWRIFRIDIFTNIRRGQKDELGRLLPELVLLTAPNIREYFYTKIRFSTPGPNPLNCINLGSKSSGWHMHVK